MISVVVYKSTLPTTVDCNVKATMFKTNIDLIKSDYDAIQTDQTIITSDTLLNRSSLPISKFIEWRTSVQPLLDNDTLASIDAAQDDDAKKKIKDG